MERFNALGRGTQLMLVGSVLLLIVSFFNWQEVDFDLGPLGEGSAGVSAWDNFLGIVMGIVTIVLIARIVARLASIDVPIPVSYAMTCAVLAFLMLAFALLKNLTDDYSTFWSYLGVGLAALVAVGAWMEIQAAGGVDSLKSEASSYGSSTGGAASAAPAAATEPPAAPVEDTSAPAHETAHGTTSGASRVADDASAAASDRSTDAPGAPDATSDTASDEPSTRRES